MIKKSTKYSLMIIGILLGIFATIFIFSRFCHFNNPGIKTPVKYIAYIGRFADINEVDSPEQQRQKRFDMLHKMVIKKYINQFNRSQKQLELRLKVFDNEENWEVSQSIYSTKIANDENILVVIDNTWGKHLQPCAKIIREKKIPVISLNADKWEADFGNYVLFLGYDDNTPDDVVKFMTDIMEAKEVVLIAEREYNLTKRFKDIFDANNIKIIEEFYIENDKPESNEQIRTFLRTIEDFFIQDPQNRQKPIVINTHGDWGNKLVEFLDERFDGLTILGGPYIARSSTFTQLGRKHVTNQFIILTDPQDAMPNNVYSDLKSFQEINFEVFQGLNAPLYMKRCLDAMAIIRGTISDTSIIQNPKELSRADFVTFFMERLKNNILKGEFDLYEFDSDLKLKKEISFITYKGGTVSSCPQQLNIKREVIPNLSFGLEVLNIYDINLNTNSFAADFFYWVKLDTTQKDAEKYILFRNLIQLESSKDLVIQKSEASTLYKLYKVSAKFHENYEMQNYPLDVQSLRIYVEIINPSDKLRISFDSKSFEKSKANKDQFKIRAWDILDYFMTVDNLISGALRGEPQISDSEFRKFKILTVHLSIQRLFSGPFLEILLPLILIAIVGISLLFVKDISFNSIGDVTVGTFLGIITFSIALSHITPNSDELTKADLLFWLTFSVILVCFLTVIFVNSKYTSEQTKNVSIRFIRYAIPLFYILGLIYIRFMHPEFTLHSIKKIFCG